MSNVESQFARMRRLEARGARTTCMSPPTARCAGWSATLVVIPAVVKVDERIYYTLGWTIVATTENTRFTNDRTGHGMSVSIDEVGTY